MPRPRQFGEDEPIKDAHVLLRESTWRRMFKEAQAENSSISKLLRSLAEEKYGV